MQQNTFEFPYLKTKACVAAPVLIAARERGNINTPLSLQIGLLMRKLYKIMIFAKSHAIPILKHELIILSYFNSVDLQYKLIKTKIKILTDTHI